MQRRQFLQLSSATCAMMSLPMMTFANTTSDLLLPVHLQGNPLLNFADLPDFANVKPEHIKPAVDFLLEHNRATVLALSTQKNITWQSFYLPLEEATNKLERAWSIVAHLHSVKNSDELRKAYNDSQKSLTEYSTWYGMHKPLYDAFNRLKKGKEYKSYSQAQKKAIDNALLEFKLSGIELTGDKAERYGKVVARLSELSTKYSNNVLDANMGWDLVIDDKAKLAGLPDSALAAAQKSAKDKGLDGYRFTLDFPSYVAVVSYADDRELRKAMYEAFRTRASDQGPNAGKWDNTDIINEMIELRLEMATLLGFKTYADYALARRMAESPKQVLDFLNGLLAKSQPKARAELAELEAYGKSLGVIDTLTPWDTTYLSEKQKKERYSIDKEAVRVYFPEHKVLAGLFETASRLFNIDIREKQGVSVCHPSVRFFEVYRNDTHIASFYLDLYARENKRGGAWMSSSIDRKRTKTGEIQLPVIQLVCNFGEPIDGKPALLLHDEVETLYHEFGHGLHGMLTQVDVLAVSGINGVAWDAVEWPSQMLENWTWHKEGLSVIATHYETGEPIPDSMMEKMLEAKNYLAASGLVRQLELALFDFRLHHEYQAGDKEAAARLREELKRTVGVLSEPEWTRMSHSFSHIFAGGYSAGYYSYLWADVLATDSFSRFEQEGVFSSATGQAYLDAFLAQGGSDSPMNMFRAFMGREPKPDALLKQLGIM